MVTHGGVVMIDPETRLQNILVELGKIVPSILDERQRRLICGCISKGYGYGGDKVVSDIFGIDPRTVSSGRKTLKSNEQSQINSEIELENRDTPQVETRMNGVGNRVRSTGAGRKSAAQIYPNLLSEISSIVQNNTYGNPEQVLFWTNLSLRDISKILKERGIIVGKDVVSRALAELGYSKQCNQKHEQVGEPHPNRDEIFQSINKLIGEFEATGDPVISTDTKKKELIGNFKNNGQEYCIKKSARRVLDHDFPISALGKVAPYGIYVLNNNTGFVNLGTDHDTSEFAVESIRRWWFHIGIENFDKSKRLLIVCDSGGSNGWRTRLWKYGLAQFADEAGIELQICHLPPGTSKWNKVEHRMFCYISKNWAGKPLIDIKTVVNYITSTTTKTGLKVNCHVDLNVYKKSVKISDKQFELIDMEKDDTFGDYIYVIKGLKKCR